MEKKSFAQTLKAYPRVYWMVILMEFFERGAYYGLMSVLSAYLALAVTDGGLGFSKVSIGAIKSTITPLLYFLPILSGALADRYGYRKFLLLAFTCLSAGYFFSGFMTGYGAIFGTLLIMAVGAGFFKPLISATIARTTDQTNSSLGFGIYYWSINLGATIIPLAVAVIKQYSWPWVFFTSALMTGVMIIPTLFWFKDPPKPENTKPLGRILKDMVMVLADWRFILLIVLYSLGFWVLYFQMFDSMLWYFHDFMAARMGPVNEMVTALLSVFGYTGKWAFNEAHITVINAGTIICLQLLVSQIVAKRKALPTMITGICIAISGMLLVAFSMNPWLFLLGLVVFSVGEMTLHPKFISYVGLIAPEDKKATYMGYLFLYGVIGSGIGGILGGWAYHYFVELHNAPRTLWLFFCAIGAVSLVGLILYNAFVAHHKPAQPATQ
jgi:dipeptide/tripeptide permease